MHEVVEVKYVKFMPSAVFTRGQSSPCLLYHPGKDIRTVVYSKATILRSLGLNIISIGAKRKSKGLMQVIVKRDWDRRMETRKQSGY